MRTRTSALLIAVGLLDTLTACGGEEVEAKPGAPPSFTAEQCSSARAAAGLPDPTPGQEAAFVVGLDAIDKDLAHGKAGKAAGRGRSQCQTIDDWPKDEAKQTDLARQRFTSHTHPEGRTPDITKRINQAPHSHLCPNF